MFQFQCFSGFQNKTVLWLFFFTPAKASLTFQGFQVTEITDREYLKRVHVEQKALKIFYSSTEL